MGRPPAALRDAKPSVSADGVRWRERKETAMAMATTETSLNRPDRGPVDTAQTDLKHRRHNRPPETALHAGVVLLTAGMFAIICLAYWVAFGGQLQSAFMVGIATAFLLAYTVTPRMLLRVKGPDPDASKISFGDFLAGDMEILTGRMRGWEAMVNVMLIPAALALAAIGTAVILILVRNGTL